MVIGMLAARPLGAQCPDGTPPPCAREVARAAAATPAAHSVAVLYFVPRDSADAYLADGLTEDVATSLGRVDRIQVKAPSSVRRAQRSSPGDLRGMGRALGVRYVVEGGLRRAGARMRVSVRLVIASDEVTAWGETYDRTTEQLLDLPGDIAQAVAAVVAGTLAPGERASVTARATRDPRAYEHLLRGNFHLARRNEHAMVRAIDEYVEATRRDGGLTAAWATISFAYGLAWFWGWDYRALSRDSLLGRARDASDRALRLDSASAEAWMARGYYLISREPRTMEGALAALERAVALDPRNAETWHLIGTLHMRQGRDAEADRVFRRTLAIEPDRAITLHFLAQLTSATGNAAEALELEDSAIAVDPSFAPGRLFRTALLVELGRVAEARADLAAASRLPVPPRDLAALESWVATAAGDTLAARAHAQRVVAALASREWLPVHEAPFVVLALAAAGWREDALRLLEAVEPRGGLLWFYGRLRPFDPLRTEPRFQRVMADARPPGAPVP